VVEPDKVSSSSSAGIIYDQAEGSNWLKTKVDVKGLFHTPVFDMLENDHYRHAYAGKMWLHSFATSFWSLVSS
jgi:hypothetical protein